MDINFEGCSFSVSSVVPVEALHGPTVNELILGRGWKPLDVQERSTMRNLTHMSRQPTGRVNHTLPFSALRGTIW